MRNLEIQSGVFIRPSDYVDNLQVLGVAKVFTVPANAKYARISGGTDFNFKYGSTTVTFPSTVVDGTGGTLIPATVGERFIIVTAGDTLAVNTGSTAVTTNITAEYWRI